MSQNRLYMQYLDNGWFLNPDFVNGLETFIEFASSQPMLMEVQKTKCPCRNCKNIPFRIPYTVWLLIAKHGFVKNYYIWAFQGSATNERTSVSDHESNVCHNDSDNDEVKEKLHKAKKNRAGS